MATPLRFASLLLPLAAALLSCSGVRQVQRTRHVELAASESRDSSTTEAGAAAGSTTAAKDSLSVVESATIVSSVEAKRLDVVVTGVVGDSGVLHLGGTTIRGLAPGSAVSANVTTGRVVSADSGVLGRTTTARSTLVASDSSRASASSTGVSTDRSQSSTTKESREAIRFDYAWGLGCLAVLALAVALARAFALRNRPRPP